MTGRVDSDLGIGSVKGRVKSILFSHPERIDAVIREFFKRVPSREIARGAVTENDVLRN